MVAPGRHALRPVEPPQKSAGPGVQSQPASPEVLTPGPCRSAAFYPADANKLRPAVISEKTDYQLYERLSAELATQPQQAPKIKISDSTTIDLWASVFPRAQFRTRNGAIKLHLGRTRRSAPP